MKKKNLLRTLTAVLLSCTVLSGGARAFADVIMEPYNSSDRFYELYYKECELESTVRHYTALTDMEIMESPLSDKAVRTVKEGDILHTNAFYTDSEGVRWAYAYYWGDDDKSGWYKAENAEVIYDHISFVEEHEDELTEYKGQLSGFTPKEQVVLWKYPNSGEANRICPAKNWFPDEYVFTLDYLGTYTYIDENGSEWVYIRYEPEGWVYTADPESDLNEKQIWDSYSSIEEPVTSFAEDAEESISEAMISSETASSEASVGITAADGEAQEKNTPEETFLSEAIPEPSQPQETQTNFLLPVGLALCAAAASGIIIAALKKKK